MRLRSLSSKLILATVLSLVVAACGGGTATTAPAATATTPPQATRATAAPIATTAPTATTVAVPTGQFRFLGQNIPGSGFLPGNGTFHYQIEPMYDELIGLDVKTQLEPNQGFISSWSMSPDAKQWTFKSKTGVLFHNGDKASAADVKASLEWYINPDSGSGFSARALILDRVDVVDETTSVAMLKVGDVFFTYKQLTSGGTPWSADLLIPGKYVAEKGFKFAIQNPIGSGPYKFKRGDNAEIEYEATGVNHFFYGQPKYKTVTITVIPESNTRIALLKAAGAEAAFVPIAPVGDLRANGFDIVISQNQKTAYINIADQFRPTVTGGGPNPFTDARVRQAISIAIDRDLLNEKFLNKTATPTIAKLSPRDIGYKEGAYTVPKQDLAKAKALLAEAGYPNGFAMDFYLWQVCNGIDNCGEILEAIAVWWEAIGLKVNRNPTTDVAFCCTGQAPRSKHDFSAPTVAGAWNGFNFPITAGVPTGIKNVLLRDTEDPEVDRLLIALSAVKSTEDYISTVRALEDVYVNKWITLPLFYNGDAYAIKKGSGGATWNIGQKGIALNLNALLTGKSI